VLDDGDFWGIEAELPASVWRDHCNSIKGCTIGDTMSVRFPVQGQLCRERVKKIVRGRERAIGNGSAV
jgi:hypothetical protein